MVDYQAAGWLQASANRFDVAQYLTEQGPAVPTTIGEETGLDVSHVSRALGELRDRGHAELLVSEDTKKGRVYGAADSLSELVDTAEEL